MTEDEDEWGEPPPDDDEIDRMHEAEDKERLLRTKAAGQKIREGFLELRTMYGHKQAWKYLEYFYKMAKPPRKPKGKHFNRNIDHEFVAAHRDAPKGRKIAAVYEVGRRYRLSPEAALQRLRRAQRSEKVMWQWILQQEEQRAEDRRARRNRLLEQKVIAGDDPETP